MSQDLSRASQDSEIVALSQNSAFWRLYDRALALAAKEGWTTLEGSPATAPARSDETPPSPTPPPPDTPPDCIP